MIRFSYDYLSQQEVFAAGASLSTMGGVDIIILLTLCGMTIFATFFLIPGYIIMIDHVLDTRKKKNKKKLLTQILLKKEIEDEVEREIKIEEKDDIITEEK